MFAINQTVFDTANKEFVKLTNGTDANGVFVPTEAIALRVIDILKNGKVQIAFTYRKVDVSKLTTLTPATGFTTDSDVDHFETLLSGNEENEHYQFIGRV